MTANGSSSSAPSSASPTDSRPGAGRPVGARPSFEQGHAGMHGEPTSALPDARVFGTTGTALQNGESTGFLIAQFRTFYAEVLSLAAFAERQAARPTNGTDGDNGTLDGLVISADDAISPPSSTGAATSVAPPPPAAPPPVGAPGVPPALAARLAAQDQNPNSASFSPSPPPGAPASGPETADKERFPPIHSAGGAVMVEQMVRHLAQVLDQGSEQALRLGGAYGSTLFDDAKYAMAALADEVFLHQVAWAGTNAWGQTLLETRLFDSAIAGERLFRNIDTLLNDASPMHMELASVYLMVLTVGFRGRYRMGGNAGAGSQGAGSQGAGSQGEAILEQYRARLRRFIGHRVPLVSADQPIFASSYQATLDEGRELMLPAIARWVVMLMAALVLYLAISHGLWVWLTGPVRQVISGG